MASIIYLVVMTMLYSIESVAKSVAVDLSIGTASENIYPSLQEAFQALYDSNNQLIEYNNSITLLPSCASQALPLSSANLRGLSTGGILNITFPSMSDQNINQFEICSQLPIIDLSSANSFVDISSLTYLSISGVTLQFSASENTNLLSNIETVNFVGFCFNSTEPTLGSSDSLTTSMKTTFILDQISTILMSNGMYIYDAFKTLQISGSNQVNLTSMTFFILSTTRDLNNQALNISSPTFAETSVDITGLNVICEPGDIVMPTFIYTSNITAVNISDYKLTNCNFSLPNNFDQHLGYFSLTSNVSISKVTINNTNIGTSVLGGHGMYFTYIITPYNGNISMNIELKNWIINCSNISYYSAITFAYIKNSTHLKSAIFQNISLSYSKVFWYGYIIYFNVFTYQLPSLTIQPITIQISQIEFNQNEIVDYCKCFYLIMQIPLAIPAVEIVKFNVNSVNIQDTSVNGSAIITTDSAFLAVKNLQIQRVTLINAAFVIKNNMGSVDVIGTLFVLDSTFKDMNISQASAIIHRKIISLASDKIECGLVDLTKGVLYAFTRPYIVSNCTFTNLTLMNDSMALRSTNPEIIIQNNIFNEITIFDSQILELGNYLNVITDKTVCRNILKISLSATGGVLASLSTSSLPQTSNFAPFLEAETILFQSYPDAAAIFYRARNLSSAYDSANSVFILSVTDNLFTNINSNASENFVKIQQFEISKSSVSVMNNTLLNSLSTKLGLIQIQEVSRVFWTDNTIANCTAKEYVLDLSTSYLQTLLIRADSIRNSSNLGGYLIQSSLCSSISLQDNTARNLFVTKPFVKIVCDVFSSQITMSDFQFRDISIESIVGVLAPVNLIAIKIKTSQGSAVSNPQALKLQNNLLSNITLINKEGFMSKLVDNSLILISASHSALSISNSNFTTLSVSPRGSILMVSIPSIVITDSTFSSLTYWDLKGALNLVFESLVINGTTFENNIGENYNGAGLMRFTNPHPNKNLLNVLIHNSAFLNNSAPYGTLLYTETTSIKLNFTQNNVASNILKQQEGGLFDLYNISNSSLVIERSNFDVGVRFDQQPGSTAFSANILSVEKSWGTTTIEVSNCSLVSNHTSTGALFSFYSNELVVVNATQLTYEYHSLLFSLQAFKKVALPSYGILQTDGAQTTFTSLTVCGVSLEDNPLFLLNYSASEKKLMTLKFKNSSFDDLSLGEGMFLIDSHGESDDKPLDNLSVLIENCSFSNILLGAYSSPSVPSILSVGAGIFSSLTRLLGRASSIQSLSPYAITITDSFFSKIYTDSSGGALFSGIAPLYNGILLLQNCEFDSIGTYEGGGVLKFTADTSISPSYTLETSTTISTISVINCTFQGLAASNGGFLFWESLSKPINVSLDNCSFTDIELMNNGLVFLSYSPMNWEIGSNQQLSSISTIVFNTNNCTFTGITARNGGVFYIEGSTKFFELTIRESSFQNIEAISNGAIFHIQEIATSTASAVTSRILSDNSQTGIISILENQFTNLSAQNGGLMFEKTSNGTLSIALQNSQLENITAQGKGGIFYVNQPMLSIASNSLLDCYAASAGAILYFSSSAATIDLNDFISSNLISNSLSAADLRAEAADIPIISFAPSNLKVELLDNNSFPLQFDNYQDKRSSPIISNLTSYSLESLTMRFTLIYVGAQGVQTVLDDSVDPEIMLIFTAPDGRSMSYSSDDTCSDSICTFDPSSIRLVGKAEEIFTVNATYISQAYIQSQVFYIKLRACLPGEVNDTVSEECIYCKKGSYSINRTDTNCRVCPEGADCLGGASILIEPGFYRSPANDTVLMMVSCNDSRGLRCLGGIENTCKEAFTGPACLQCNLQNEFINTNSGACSKCLPQRTLIFLVVLTFMSSIIYQLLLVRSAFREGKRSHNYLRWSARHSANPKMYLRPGAFMLIFSSFSQITSILADNDTTVFKEATGITSTLSNTSQQVMLSLKCLIYLKVLDPMDSMTIQLLLMVLLPFIKLLLLVVFELLKNLIFTRGPGAWATSLIRIGTIAVVVIILEQPGIIGFLGNYLNCNKLDPYVETEYIVKSNTVECGTEKYYNIRKYLVIPGLLFWGLVVPIGIYLAMRINRRKLNDSQNLRILLGHFYSSYTKKAYYWGLFLFMIKMSIFIFNSAMTKYLTMKYLILLSFFHLYKKFYMRVKPYEHSSLDRVERYTITAYNLILILLLFQTSTENEAALKACSIAMLVVKTFIDGYILFHVFYLRLNKWFAIYQRFRDRAENKQIMHEILEHLQFFHASQPSWRDKHYRRSAISLELPIRLRNTELYKKQRVDLRTVEKHSGSWGQIAAKAKQFIKRADLVSPTFVDLRREQSNTTAWRTHAPEDPVESSPKINEVSPEIVTTRVQLESEEEMLRSTR